MESSLRDGLLSHGNKLDIFDYFFLKLTSNVFLCIYRITIYVYIVSKYRHLLPQHRSRSHTHPTPYK